MLYIYIQYLVLKNKYRGEKSYVTYSYKQLQKRAKKLQNFCNKSFYLLKIIFGNK